MVCWVRPVHCVCYPLDSLLKRQYHLSAKSSKRCLSLLPHYQPPNIRIAGMEARGSCSPENLKLLTVWPVFRVGKCIGPLWCLFLCYDPNLAWMAGQTRRAQFFLGGGGSTSYFLGSGLLKFLSAWPQKVWNVFQTCVCICANYTRFLFQDKADGLCRIHNVLVGSNFWNNCSVLWHWIICGCKFEFSNRLHSQLSKCPKSVRFAGVWIGSATKGENTIITQSAARSHFQQFRFRGWERQKKIPHKARQHLTLLRMFLDEGKTSNVLNEFVRSCGECGECGSAPAGLHTLRELSLLMKTDLPNSQKLIAHTTVQNHTLCFLFRLLSSRNP